MAESMKTYSSRNQIQVSKKSKYCDLSDQFGYEICGNQPAHGIQWFKVNDRRFRSGSLILNDGRMNEITKILAVGNSFYFVCLALSFVSVENELSSVKIEKYTPETKTIIEYSSDIHTNVYEKIKCNGNDYVFIGNLEVARAISK